MFPQFGATAESLSKASTLVFRIGTDAHLYDDPEDVNIAPLLDSKFDSEKCEALKRLLALIAQGFDVSNFFPQVVKNVASQSLEVKKLVYLYLLHYAEKRPNEALLSINCFQKDLGDPNPLVRAWALRAMAGIRLHVIAPIVLVAVAKCARDPSVFVRKCAANALPKLHDLRLEENISAIEEIVGLLLNDNSPEVVGAAASAFTTVCPNNFSLVGRNYRRLCEILPDVEEWGQIILIGILLRYVIARHGLAKESIMFSLCQEKECSSGKTVSEDDEPDFTVKEGADYGSGNTLSELANMIFHCYIERPDEYLSRSRSPNKCVPKLDASQFSSSSNDDVKMLLQCTSPLLWSNNSAVVLAAAGVHWIMASRDDVKKIVKPILFLLRSSYASRYVVLCNIQAFAKAMPSLLVPHYEDFFICSSDSYQIKALKLEILSSIATDSSVSFILREFQDYIKDPDRRFAAETVASIGLCAQKIPKTANACVEWLLTLIRHELTHSEMQSVVGEEGVLIRAIISIKTIIKLDPPSYEKVIIQLVRSLNTIKVPAARAMIIWMMGEYCSLGEIIPRMLSTVLKYLARYFTSEALETKLQILNTAAKAVLCSKKDDIWSLQRVLIYVVELAEHDLNYDIRDRSRFVKKLFSWNWESQQNEEEESNKSENSDLSYVLARCIFGGQTKTVTVSSEPVNYRFYLPGSLSQIVVHAAPGYEPLPKPCSLPYNDFDQYDGVDTGDLDEEEDPGTSGSLDEESASDYSSEHSYTGSSDASQSDETVPDHQGDENTDPLIQILDTGIGCKNQNGVSDPDTADFGDLLSTRALESWLDEQPGLSTESTTEQGHARRSSARITIGNIRGRVRTKCYMLFDSANGNGLKVNYSFSSETSSISPQLICLELFFENCSMEPISDIVLIDEDSSKGSDSTDQTSPTAGSALKIHTDMPTLVSMDEISSLEPSQTEKRTLQVHFHHHLLPLKLALFCNGNKFPVKLRPDIGYFVKPLPISIEDFRDKESYLRGMFEYVRSCTFTDHIEEMNKDNSLTKDKFLVICESLALKMLSNANVSLVSVDMPVTSNLDDASGLCLRFSSEILSNSMPCLLTITVEGKCSDPLSVSIKVNCEETVFGLNFLNRVVNFLVEQSGTQS